MVSNPASGELPSCRFHIQPQSNSPEPANKGVQGCLITTDRCAEAGLELKSAGWKLSRSRVGDHCCIVYGHTYTIEWQSWWEIWLYHTSSIYMWRHFPTPKSTQVDIKNAIKPIPEEMCSTLGGFLFCIKSTWKRFVFVGHTVWLSVWLTGPLKEKVPTFLS